MFPNESENQHPHIQKIQRFDGQKTDFSKK